MDCYDFYSPACFAFGPDREREAGAPVKRFNGAKVDELCNGDGRPDCISGFVTLDERDCEAACRLIL